MKKLYIFTFLMLFVSATYAHEVLSFTNNDDAKKIQTEVTASYSNGKLSITGINTTTNIAIYNLLGRKVVDLKNIAIKGRFSTYLDLPMNNIYIVKIYSSTFSKTFKIVAK